MTENNTRNQLNQKLDQLPPGILQTVVDFVDFLLHRHFQKPVSESESRMESKPIRSSSNGLSNSKVDDNIRPPKGNQLLELESGWEGDDFEECLQSVYNTRSQIKA